MRIRVTLLSVLAVFLLASCQSSEKYDSRAVASLDALSEAIGELSSCSYTLDTFRSLSDGTDIQNEHDVYMRGPDKMYIQSAGTNGEKAYWFNGSRLAFFSYTKDVYATVDAPGNIITAIEFIHNNYGIDFPAADFFYPEFTDDILANYDTVFFSEEEIDGIECNYVIASNDDENVQIWIDKVTNLPHRLVIESKLANERVYDSVFSNWRTNPELPDILFEFEPPANSEQIQLKTVN